MLFYKPYAIKLRTKILHYTIHTFSWRSRLFVLVAVHVTFVILIQVLVADGDVVTAVVLQDGLVQVVRVALEEQRWRLVQVQEVGAFLDSGDRVLEEEGNSGLRLVKIDFL